LVLTSLISPLVSPDHRVGRQVAAHLPFKNLVWIFGSLARYHAGQPTAHVADNFETALQDLISEAFGLEEQRNRLMHSSWLAGGGPAGTATRLKITARGVLKETVVEASDDEINGVADRASRLCMALVAFAANHGIPIIPEPVPADGQAP
jgi:hypothetical protein